MTNKNILFFCIETNRGKSILKIIDQKSNVQFELSTACLHSRLTVPFLVRSQLDGASSKKWSTDFFFKDLRLFAYGGHQMFWLEWFNLVVEYKKR